MRTLDILKYKFVGARHTVPLAIKEALMNEIKIIGDISQKIAEPQQVGKSRVFHSKTQ